METTRKIKAMYSGRKSMDGAGVKLTRMFGQLESPDFDPFLLLDYFDSKDSEDYVRGFPWHPHRGIETVTYLISGGIKHEDSLGNRGTINGGDCQWMTAGSGIVHKEMPVESPHLLGVQLWINLRSDKKMTDPAYNSIISSEIKSVVNDKAKVKIISGSYGGVRGNFESIEPDTAFLDVEINPYEDFEYRTESDSNVSVFVIEGKGFFDMEREDFVCRGTLASFEDGERIEVAASSEGVRFLLLSGKPLREEIAWSGPIVMNSKEELERAFEELEKGTFVKNREETID